VPAVSIAVWAALVSNFDNLRKHAMALLAAVVVCALGFAVTLGLFIYDWRNDAFYDDLISRGRKIEEELGVDTAIFRGRRAKESRFINHTWGVRLVYWPMLIGWLMALAWFTSAFWQLREWRTTPALHNLQHRLRRGDFESLPPTALPHAVRGLPERKLDGRWRGHALNFKTRIAKARTLARLLLLARKTVGTEICPVAERTVRLIKLHSECLTHSQELRSRLWHLIGVRWRRLRIFSSRNTRLEI
jgi:hypothetical protein